MADEKPTVESDLSATVEKWGKEFDALIVRFSAELRNGEVLAEAREKENPEFWRGFAAAINWCESGFFTIVKALEEE